MGDMNLGNSERLALCASALQRAQAEIERALAILGGTRKNSSTNLVYRRVNALWMEFGATRQYNPESVLARTLAVVTRAQVKESGRTSDHGAEVSHA